MGIAEQMKPKIVPANTGAEAGKLLVEGKTQYVALLVNELMTVPGVEVLGPLPPELQQYTVFHAGVGVGSKDSSAAKALIRFLTTPAAGAVFKAKGQEAG
jgi:molybdate transport system substrate-binding protein